MRLSPLDNQLFAWKAITAIAQMCAGRFDEAARWAESSLRDEPDMPPPLRVAAASYAHAGRLLEARKAMAQLCQLDPSLRLPTVGDIMPPFRRPEDRARLLEGLRKAGLPE